MSLPAKQIRSATFTLAQVNRVFGAGSIDTGVIANDAIGSTQLAAAAFGNGLTGGGGSAVSVQADTTGGAGLSTSISVTANGVAIGVDDSTLEDSGANTLRVKDAGITNAKLNADVAGAGITGGAGSALAFDTTANLTITGVHSHTPTTLQIVGAPSSANDGVNKAYADSVASGVDIKEACELATTGALPAVTAAGAKAGKTLTADANGVLTVDGVAIALNDRLLVKDQVNPIDNGIYTLTTLGTAGVPFELTRATDADGTPSNEVSGGMLTFIKGGTANGNTGWALYGITGNVTVDTDNQDFTQFQGLPDFIGGNGIDITVKTISVDLAPTPGLEFNSGKLQTSAQGNGLAGGAGALLSVSPDSTTGGNTQPVSVGANGVGLDVAAIAGTGVEADGAANLRISAQGAGIAGGGGTTISFDAAAAGGNGLTGAGAVLTVASDTVTGGNIQGANVTANGVGLDVAAIAGTSLEADGAANLRISAAAAGAGLTGGGASSLAVGAGNGITVNANDVAVDPTALVSGGTAQVDGDTLDITFVPSNYTRDVGPAEVTAVVELTAHLKGIDNAIAAAGGAPRQEPVTTQNVTGTDTALTDTLNNTPTSALAVKLYLNGILQEQGVGKAYTVSGTTITWLASTGTAVDLDTNDELLAVYES